MLIDVLRHGILANHPGRYKVRVADAMDPPALQRRPHRQHVHWLLYSIVSLAMQANPLQLVGRLAGSRVLVIGDVMLDRYIWGNADRISPEAPIPVLRADRREERIGGGAGVAAILRALDATVTLAGVVGSDRAGARCLELLANRGVDTDLLMTDPDRPTTLKERYIGRADRKHPQQVLRVDYESHAPIGDGHIRQLTADLRKRLPEHDIVLVSDYGKGVCRHELMQTLAHDCKQQGILVIADPGQKAPSFARFRGFSSITPNRREASVATGIAINDPATACAVAERLRIELGLEAAIITLDRDGMVLSDASGQHHLPTRERQVYDITGAGDVVLAVLGLGIASGLSYAEAIALANVAAGLSVERIGVTVVTRQEIIEDLVRHRPIVNDKLIASRVVLAQEMDLLRAAGRRIVFTNGCFDLLHSGHIHVLREARRQGDLLVVGLNSDDSVRRLNKAPDRPINPQLRRAGVLAGLAAVDYICIFDEETPTELIRAVRPHVMVKGSDYRPEQIAGWDFVQSYGGRLHLVDLLPDTSTTDTIARIKKS